MRLLAEAVAGRYGRRPDDPAVRALAGAVVGVRLSPKFAAAEDPEADVVSLIDEGLAQLEAGFPWKSAGDGRPYPPSPWIRTQPSF